MFTGLTDFHHLLNHSLSR